LIARLARPVVPPTTQVKKKKKKKEKKKKKKRIVFKITINLGRAIGTSCK
jgi:hypothetical protein